MESHNENDVHPEGNPNANDIAPPEEGHSEAIQILETMRQLIVEYKVLRYIMRKGRKSSKRSRKPMRY